MINILIFGMGVSVTFIVPVDYQGALFRMFDYYIMKMFDKNMFNRYLMEKSLSNVKPFYLWLLIQTVEKNLVHDIQEHKGQIHVPNRMLF